MRCGYIPGLPGNIAAILRDKTAPKEIPDTPGPRATVTEALEMMDRARTSNARKNFSSFRARVAAERDRKVDALVKHGALDAVPAPLPPPEVLGAALRVGLEPAHAALAHMVTGDDALPRVGSPESAERAPVAGALDGSD